MAGFVCADYSTVEEAAVVSGVAATLSGADDGDVGATTCTDADAAADDDDAADDPSSRRALRFRAWPGPRRGAPLGRSAAAARRRLSASVTVSFDVTVTSSSAARATSALETEVLMMINISLDL